MTQTINMAEFEGEPDVFPETEQALFLGGPKHGQMIEVVTGDPTHKLFSKSAPPPIIAPNVPMPSLSAPVMEVHTYLRRDLAGDDEATGDRYMRSVYVHESVPNPEIAQRLLMAALLSSFVKGGRKVIDSDGVSNV